MTRLLLALIGTGVAVVMVAVAAVLTPTSLRDLDRWIDEAEAHMYGGLPAE